MSDILDGWAELLSKPLGKAPPDDLPLAALPCIYDLARAEGPAPSPPPRGPEG